MNFGQNLKERRKAKGLTQMQLSKKTKIPQTSISGWETGRYVPSITDAIKLAKALGCTLNALVEKAS